MSDGELIPYGMGPDCQPSGNPFRDLIPRTAQMSDDELIPVHACCDSWGPEHRYRCPHRVWPSTATPEIRRLAVRGDCIAPAHAQIEDLGVHGLDYQQRKRLTEILAQVWDDGFGYGQQGTS